MSKRIQLISLIWGLKRTNTFPEKRESFEKYVSFTGNQKGRNMVNRLKNLKKTIPVRWFLVLY